MNKYKSGYTVDNLGLPVWVVKALSEEFQGKSIHYAIQQILKNRYSNKHNLPYTGEIMPKEVYIPCTKSFFLASQAVNTETGEVIELTPVHKLLYFYCKDQYDFFISRGQKFTASWGDLCCAINIPYNSSKTKSVIADLQKMNLVVVEGGRKSNNKVVRRCDNKRCDNNLVWELHNPQYTEFTSDEAKAKRVSDKKERLKKYKKRPKNNGCTSYYDDSIDGVGNCAPDADYYETLPTITEKSIESFEDDEDWGDEDWDEGIPF